MGVVYVAEHLQLKKRVALKMIRPDHPARAELLLRFRREALATGQLEHPHIPSAIDFGELEGGGAFMVMPLVRGRSLQLAMEAEHTFEPRRAARIGAEIADALSAAHAVGIVHRDLKPDNVLLEPQLDGSEAVKVLDFGVAGLVGRAEEPRADTRRLTQAGMILGTPGYMSPEQAAAGEVDQRTDLYALGVILWELCRGERLFDGDDLTEIFTKQVKALPAVLELGASAPERELSELVALLLALDKNARPASAAEVRDRLRGIAEAPTARSGALPRRLWSKLGQRQRRVAAGITALLLLLLLTPRSRREHVGPRPSTPSMQGADAAKRPPAREATPNAGRKAPDHAPEKSALKARKQAGPVDALEVARASLLDAKSRQQRRETAELVMSYGEGVPRYLRLVAELELSDSCRDKKAVLAELRALSDPRALPALERRARQPPHGCGLLKFRDCLACVRRDLDQTIGALRGTSVSGQ